jgi:hypothetical protein
MPCRQYYKTVAYGPQADVNGRCARVSGFTRLAARFNSQESKQARVVAYVCYGARAT